MFTFTSYESTFTYNLTTQEVFWGSKFVGYAANLEDAKTLADDQCEIELWG